MSFVPEAGRTCSVARKTPRSTPSPLAQQPARPTYPLSGSEQALEEMHLELRGSGEELEQAREVLRVEMEAAEDARLEAKEAQTK